MPLSAQQRYAGNGSFWRAWRRLATFACIHAESWSDCWRFWEREMLWTHAWSRQKQGRNLGRQVFLLIDTILRPTVVIARLTAGFTKHSDRGTRELYAVLEKRGEHGCRTKSQPRPCCSSINRFCLIAASSCLHKVHCRTREECRWPPKDVRWVQQQFYELLMIPPCTYVSSSRCMWQHVKEKWSVHIVTYMYWTGASTRMEPHW